MVYQISLPLNEGPVPRDPLALKIMSREEWPIDVGSIDPDAFHSLGDWSHITYCPGYSFAYRIAHKTGILDPDGDISDLVILFGAPIHSKHLPFTDDISAKLYRQMQLIVQNYIVQAADEGRALIGIAMDPPPYMIQELESLLRDEPDPAQEP